MTIPFSVFQKFEDTAGPVREAAFEAIGTAMKVVGERVFGQYLDSLDKIKQDKVKEYFEKAEINATGGGGGGAAAAPKAAPAASKPAAAPPAKEEPKPKAAGVMCNMLIQ